MSTDLERLVRGIEGEPPSAEFRARLRAQIVAETEGIEDPGHDLAVVIDLESQDDDPPQPARPPRLGLLVACAAAVVLVVGLWTAISGDDESGEDITTETPEEDVVAADPLTAGNTVFDAGTFRIDTLGTAFTFEVDQQTGILVNDDGIVSLNALTSLHADDRTITFRRTSLLPDPAAPTARVDAATGWPATDLAGWLGLLGDEVTASEPTDTTLGGVRATSVRLDFACDGGPCRAGDLLADPGIPVFTPGSRYRLWVVPQAAEDPIVITVAVGAGGDEAWFDEADGILSSLTFDSVGPNPVRLRQAGSVELDAFDGFRVELDGEATVVEPHDGFARIVPPGIGGDVELLTRPLDTAGVAVTSTERLLEILETEAVMLTELAPTDMGGQRARVFAIDSGPFPTVVLKTRTEDLARDDFGWQSPGAGHLWVVEHPDRGLLVVSTETLSGPDQLEPLFAWGQELVSSLEFGS